MKVGSLVEGHRSEVGIVLGVEAMYPNHPDSPPRNLMVHWFTKPPRNFRQGQWLHVAGIKRTLSSKK